MLSEIAIRLLLTMMFSAVSILTFVWLRHELATRNECSIELCIVLVTVDAAIFLGALDICCMFWWDKLCVIEKPMYSSFGLLTVVAAVFIVNQERRVRFAPALPEGLPWRQQLPHFYRHKGRHLAAAATMRFVLIVAHGFWIARIPKWS
jgi:hypothetical protein